MKKLTEKQKDILNFISDFSTDNKMSPTVYEIADEFNIKTSTVFAHLKALQKKNYLHRSSKARSITLKKTPAKKNYSGVHSIPLQKRDKNIRDQTIFCDAELLFSKQKYREARNCYAIILEENTYLSRGILPGDIAILMKDPRKIHPGDLFIAQINDHQELLECKKIFDQYAEFYNINAKTPVTFPLDALPIEGKLIGIQRSL